MNVVWHDDKLVQQEFSLSAIVKQNIDQKPRPSLDPKDGQAPPSDGRDKERTLRIHRRDRSVVTRESIVMSVTRRTNRFQNGKRRQE